MKGYLSSSQWAVGVRLTKKKKKKGWLANVKLMWRHFKSSKRTVLMESMEMFLPVLPNPSSCAALAETLRD